MAEFISFAINDKSGFPSKVYVNLANIAMAQINAEASTVQLTVAMPNGANIRLPTLSGPDAINVIAKLEKCS